MLTYSRGFESGLPISATSYSDVALKKISCQARERILVLNIPFCEMRLTIIALHDLVHTMQGEMRFSSAY
jgi:hypothetical protein